MHDRLTERAKEITVRWSRGIRSVTSGLTAKDLREELAKGDSDPHGDTHKITRDDGEKSDRVLLAGEVSPVKMWDSVEVQRREAETHHS